jgi:hypothetical protein
MALASCERLCGYQPENKTAGRHFVGFDASQSMIRPVALWGGAQHDAKHASQVLFFGSVRGRFALFPMALFVCKAALLRGESTRIRNEFQISPKLRSQFRLARNVGDKTARLIGPIDSLRRS